MDDVESAIQAIEELQAPQPPRDWRTRWQLACEVLWDSLISCDQSSVSWMDVFVQLLKDKDKFALAQLVIPALRGIEGEEVDNIHQRKILEQAGSLRRALHKTLTRRQEDFDDELYKEEKRIFTESEMHLARIMLHDSEPFGSVKEEAIADWLAAAPLDTRSASTHQRT